MQAAAVWARSFKADLSVARDFAMLLSGSAGRLVLSLAYFVSVANALSVADFGLFATASATGIVLSRIAGFGFVSPLYRASTRRRELIGVYTAGLLLAFALSLPAVVAAAAVFFALFFDGDMTPAAFSAIVAAEVLFWRALEVVCIVNNGLGRFGRAAAIVIAGSAFRAGAALLFALLAAGSLETWSLAYLGVNALAAAAAVATSYPRRRLRFASRLYRARAADSFAVAGAEILFYLQSELDKLLVLSLGGARMAGLYAILMRLVDLTALPVRAFNTMAVQKLMKTPDWLRSWRMRWGLEAAVAAVSVAGLAFLGGFLHFFPTALGGNVSDAAPLVLLALFVPAFRNLVEYESELLYARGRSGVRALVLALLGVMKAGLLTLLLLGGTLGDTWIIGLNGVFLTLWMISASASYTALDGLWGRPRAPAAARLSPAAPPAG